MNNFQHRLTNDIPNYSSKQFYEIFCDIFNGKYDENFIIKFLVDLNFYNLPNNAFIGSIQALRQEMTSINAPQNCLDVCGTGGDKLNTLNVSTAVSFILASSGVCVAKHGNKAISSRSGSADIFFELGIKISEDKNFLERNLREKKLAFLFAPFFHPALKKISPIRQKLKEPTIFNFLGPLLNPAKTNLQLIGTSRFDTMNKIANVIALDSKNHAYIVNGFDSMDEISISNKSYLLEVKNGEIGELQIIDPTKFNFKLVAHEAIAGRDANYNAQKLIALLDGEKSPYRDIVVLNSAYALMLCDIVKRIEDGIDLAQSLIDSYKAKEILVNLR
jgi:anthranilate phosphoribosyltransferase